MNNIKEIIEAYNEIKAIYKRMGMPTDGTTVGPIIRELLKSMYKRPDTAQFMVRKTDGILDGVTSTEATLIVAFIDKEGDIVEVLESMSGAFKGSKKKDKKHLLVMSTFKENSTQLYKKGK